MTDKVQKIREEVERLKSNLIYGACSSQIAMETRCKEEAYNEVLASLDNTQEEPISENLEDAAIEICSEILKGETVIIDGYEYVVPSDAEECFKAGANWQKQKDAEAFNENALLYNARLEGVEIGKAEMKQQMMKQSIGGKLFRAYDNSSFRYKLDIDCDIPMEKYKAGDKVKVIVIKED